MNPDEEVDFVASGPISKAPSGRKRGRESKNATTEKSNVRMSESSKGKKTPKGVKGSKPAAQGSPLGVKNPKPAEGSPTGRKRKKGKKSAKAVEGSPSGVKNPKPAQGSPAGENRKKQKSVVVYNVADPNELIDVWISLRKKWNFDENEESFDFSPKSIRQCNAAGSRPLDFLKFSIPKWPTFVDQAIAKIPKYPVGMPLAIVICASAIRAVNLNRDLETFKTGKCRTAKLFAKHMKIAEQIDYLKKHTVHLALGTPKRFFQLIEAAALRLRHLRYIILDWNFKDEKQRRLIDVPETRTDLMELFAKHLIPFLVQREKCKILLM